jgi:hypothetical protein
MNNLSPLHYNKIEDFFKSIELNHLNVNDFITESDLDTLDFSNAFEELLDLLDEKNAFEIEIIYYRNAMDYLYQHDMSLTDSLELANELGYKTEDLNSEILASLLASQITRDAFFGLREDIDNFFANFDEK